MQRLYCVDKGLFIRINHFHTGGFHLIERIFGLCLPGLTLPDLRIGKSLLQPALLFGG